MLWYSIFIWGSTKEFLRVSWENVREIFPPPLILKICQQQILRIPQKLIKQRFREIPLRIQDRIKLGVPPLFCQHFLQDLDGILIRMAKPHTPVCPVQFKIHQPEFSTFIFPIHPFRQLRRSIHDLVDGISGRYARPCL